MTSTPFPFSLRSETPDQIFMLEALKQAWEAYQQGEVPVGAVLVLEGKIIARGFNQVEMLSDATAHAEMICLTAGASAVGDWRLLKTTLYCTLEPCAMCAGAMFLSRIEKLVYGAPDKRHGANGSWVDLFADNHPIHRIELVRGVYAEPSAELLRRFFSERRKEEEDSAE